MRTSRTVIATVAAVLVVVGGALAFDRVVGEPAATGASAAGTLPAAPEGMRWVGMDDVVVAVPDWWTTGETKCLTPVEDTVYFDSTAMTDCSNEPSSNTVASVSALAVLEGTCCYGEWKRRDMEPVDGSPAVELAGCDEWFEGVCRRLFALPGTEVVFAVTIAEEGDGDYEAIRDSIRVLPEGLTTVPLRVGSGFTPGWGTEPSLVDDTVRATERAGLQVKVEEVRPGRGRDVGLGSDLPRGSLLSVEPAPGSVVADGARVTVTVVG